MEQMADEQYPATARLRQVDGVGPLTALCFVLTVETPARFPHTRDVGSYLGLVPRRDQSGNTDKQLPITKAGIDLALHDLIGKLAGKSLPELWGRKPLERIPLSWTVNTHTIEEAEAIDKSLGLRPELGRSATCRAPIPLRSARP